MLSSSIMTIDAFITTNWRGQELSGFLRKSPTFLCSSVEAGDSGTKRQNKQGVNVESTSRKSALEKLSRPERKALERQKKDEQQQQQRSKKKSPTSLQKKHVLQLSKDSTADDVIRAIKRAQNNHDHQDLKVIADFLINDCDMGFAYGYRGSLLARLAVAALHFGNNPIARRSIDIRRLEYRPSMLPMESAAIIRGLLRVHNVTDALEILFDELSLPLEVSLTKRIAQLLWLLYP